MTGYMFSVTALLCVAAGRGLLLQSESRIHNFFFSCPAQLIAG